MSRPTVSNELRPVCNGLPPEATVWLVGLEEVTGNAASSDISVATFEVPSDKAESVKRWLSNHPVPDSIQLLGEPDGHRVTSYLQIRVDLLNLPTNGLTPAH